MPEPTPFAVRKVAEADFPTEYGHFRIHGFEGVSGDELEEAVVLTIGDISTPKAAA